MADSDYIPTTDTVRALYDERTTAGEFDRWLTVHDASVRCLIDSALALHRESSHVDWIGVCAECYEDWPCATVKALTVPE